MRIGELCHRLRVENPTRVADGEGGYSDTWVAASPATVWASIEPASPRAVERQVGATVEAPVSAIITIRYHAGVTTDTRLLDGPRVFMVRGIQNPSERNVSLVLACEEQ